MKTIGGLFGRSPFGPLREHMLKVLDCVGLLPELVRAFLDGNHGEVRRIAGEVSREEHDADLIKKRLRDHLSKSLFTSISRVDVLATLKEQDSIADACEKMALLLSVRKTLMPEELRDPLRRIIETAVETARLIGQCSENLLKLDEDPFPANLALIHELIESVQKSEWQMDDLQKSFLETLFGSRFQTDPVDIYFIMSIVKQAGEIGDHADNTADCMRRMLAR